MPEKFLPRHRATGSWSHPYGHGPFSPFLYADGGDGGGSGSGGNDGDGGAGGGEGAGGDGAGSAGVGGDTTGANKGGTTGGADDSAATIARLEKDLAYARGEAGKARTAAKQQAADDAVKELSARLGKALGFGEDDKAPTPEELTKALAERDAKLTAKDAALRAKDVELAVYGRAERHGAKATALLDSRSFTTAVAKLDPADGGFGDSLDAAIKKAVKDNPTAFAITPAGRSGGDLGGGTGESGAKKRAGSLAGAISDHYRT